MKKTICTAAFAAFSLFGGLAHAQASNTILVEFQGPGGHSSSNYGRTSALHAASRAVIELQKAGLPLGSYTILQLQGGNSVNSIASDGSFVVRPNPQLNVGASGLADKVNAAAKAGAEAENAFRNVKPGDLTAGAPADIRYRVTLQ